jgi:pimeloyl-ACP methyl ester carboxylesterase
VLDAAGAFAAQPQFVEARNGRRIAYSEFGAADGRPVFYCHGFPSSRREALLLHASAVATGARIIAADRPGYGNSDDQRGREIRDWSDDIVLLADRLGIEQFAILGVSGGGPYALACAYELGDRLTGCTLVCPLGPIYIDALLEQMTLPVRINLAVGKQPPWLANMLYGSHTTNVLTHWPDLVEHMRSMAAPPADRKVLAEGDNGTILNKTIADAMRSGAHGARRDLVLYTHDWGIPFAEIARPIAIWHGTADGTVPVEHARWYAAHLPGARLTELPNEGHYSVPLCYSRAILADLLAD